MLITYRVLETGVRFSLSLSLSLSHTHTHTEREREREREKQTDRQTVLLVLSRQEAVKQLTTSPPEFSGLSLCRELQLHTPHGLFSTPTPPLSDWPADPQMQWGTIAYGKVRFGGHSR